MLYLLQNMSKLKIIKVLKNTNLVNNDTNLVNNDVNLLLREIYNLKNKLKIVESNNNIRELKIQNLNIPKNIIKKYILYKTIQGEIKLFIYFYLKDIEKANYCIKYIKGRTFKYWDGNDWITDIGGLYIAEVILKNIQNSYLIINNYTNINENEFSTETFISNQLKIHKLSNEKYKQLFIQSIKSLILIKE